MQNKHMDLVKDNGFSKLLERIQVDAGFHGIQYKDKCLKRRIGTRMRWYQIGEDYNAYIKILEEKPEEYEELIKNLTINVTKFFRNWSVFEYIYSEMMPKIFAKKATNSTLKIWSAGCASGEEPYSLAILALEVKKKLNKHIRINVIGTDIDVDSLEHAKIGIYDVDSLEETPQFIRDSYFRKVNNRVEIINEVKEVVQFKKNDLFGDTPPNYIDLVCCRNVIIYFSREAQATLLEKFHSVLADDGYLVLGKTETLLLKQTHLFNRVNNRERIFSKKHQD